MHPHLADAKKIRCGELIERLQECHRRGWLVKLTGGCNEIKQDLNACLRQERLERTKRNRQESQKLNAEKQARWKEIDENR